MFTRGDLSSNKFLSKNDFKVAFESLMKPLCPFYKNSRSGRLNLGTSGSVYNKDIQQIEGFLRPLWGLGPYLSAYSNLDVEKYYLAGIKNGTNPASSDFWGETFDYDQRFVEMASLATTILLNKEKFFDEFSMEEQDNLYKWLNQINHHEIPRSNWLFFRILVNLSFKHCGREYDKARMEEDLHIIDSCYIGEGWYFDERPPQIDYYISFAIHFYSLIYYKFMKDEDKERSERIKERAILFAQTFKYWFDNQGEAIPFGRSLTYRFAQSAFWSALVYADIEAIPWGEMKAILSKNMQQWMNKEIFTTDGLLSIGYHYQNLVMAEGYNAPGSPYWSMKTFLILAVPDNHPFWEAKVQDVTYEDKQISLPEARMLISRTKNQVQAFVAGQIEPNQAHVDAKYSKLVYSTRFGVSVSKGTTHYRQGGYDCCLALSEEDNYFRSKLDSDSYAIKEHSVESKWSPWKDVTVHTEIIPIDDWHIRIHEINNNRRLHAIDGGFSVPINDNEQQYHTEEGIVYESHSHVTSIYPIVGFNKCSLIKPEPNTSLFFKRSCYPALEANLDVGNHRLISLVGGTAKNDNERPQINLDGELLQIKFKNNVKMYDLSKGEFIGKNKYRKT